MTTIEPGREVRALALIVGVRSDVRSAWSIGLEPGRETVEVEVGPCTDVSTEILERLLLGAPLRRWSERILGPPTQPTREETLFDLEGRVRAAAAAHELGPRRTQALLASAHARRMGHPLALDDLLDKGGKGVLARDEVALDVAAALQSEELPRVLVDATGSETSPGRIERVALALLRVSGLLPRLDVTFAVTPETWSNYVRWAGNGYTRTVLEQRLTRLDTSSATPEAPGTELSAEVLATARPELPGEVLATVRDLLARAPKSELTLDEVIGQIPEWRQGLSEQGQIFRSLAELILFTYLEKWPQTRGFFKPNARTKFHFGATFAEVDLLSERLAIAIEVDGAHFHLPHDEELRRRAYRRDRTKDWCYQKAGIIVLRFLAEDIPSEIQSIRARILEAAKIKEPATKRRRRGGRESSR